MTFRRSVTRRAVVTGGAALLPVLLLPAGLCAQGASTLRVGSLRFGSVNWLLDTVEAEGLAREEGVAIERVDLASNQAGTIGLQSGDIDIIVSDWPWAMRQRAEGLPLLFRPYSKALGAVMVGAQSGIGSVEDLEDRRLGVAGSALDKSWLLLQAWAREAFGMDLATAAEPVYGAPPLLSEQLRLQRIDATLTYWNFAARLEADGFRTLVEMSEVMQALGIDPPSPLVGFVWREELMETKGEAVAAFFRAVDAANQVLATSDAAWKRLRPAMQLRSPEEFVPLRERFRSGIPEPWGPAQLAASEELFALLAELGGPRLIGEGTVFDEALFWSPRS